MTYLILPSKRFQKVVKKYAKSNRRQVLEIAAEVIDLLAIHDDQSLTILTRYWQDNELKGNKKGIRELHLEQDELLLYSIDRNLKIIKLLDIVNHEQLRKR